MVPAAQYDEYAEALVEGFRSLKIGDPMEADTVVGPLVTERQRDRVEEYVELARKEGATIATGGRRPAGLDRGWYFEPTLVTDADNDMRVSREEIFGPVASLIPHHGEEDAVRIANDSELGLSGAVFTADDAHGFEIARRMRTGTFSVNTFAADLGSPFGGYKKSGIGREHGPTAYQEFLHYKTISVDPSRQLPESVTAGVRRGTGPGTRLESLRPCGAAVADGRPVSARLLAVPARRFRPQEPARRPACGNQPGGTRDPDPWRTSTTSSGWPRVGSA